MRVPRFENIRGFFANLEGDWRPVVLSLILIFIVLSVRAAGLRVARSMENAPEVVRLRWQVQIRRAVIGSLFVGLIGIWAAELRELAYSLVAFAVAFVIAGKELILCFLGAILRASSRSFSIGDRIEICGLRGDAIDHGFMTTTVLEIGPAGQRTGRSIVLPNAVFLSHPVLNETFTNAYILHVVRIPLFVHDDVERAERILLRAADEVTGEYVRDARFYLRGGGSDSRMTTSLSDHPITEPRVLFNMEKANQVEMLLRVPTPVRKKGETEQAILRRFISEWSRLNQDKPMPPMPTEEA